MLEGALEITVGDQSRVLRAGQAAIVAAGVEHSANASAPCRAIVVDFPICNEVGGGAAQAAPGMMQVGTEPVPSKVDDYRSSGSTGLADVPTRATP